jgi:predicted nucleotidyltransferase
MRRDEVIRLLADRRNELASRFGVRELVLFGSVARDLAGTESDVDFLVEFEPPPTFDRYMDLKFFLEDLLGRKVDLVTRAALKPALRPEIERDAIRIA